MRGLNRWPSGVALVLSSPSTGGRAAGDGRGGTPRTSLGRASTPWDKGSTRAPTCLREWCPPLTGLRLSLRPNPRPSRPRTPPKSESESEGENDIPVRRSTSTLPASSAFVRPLARHPEHPRTTTYSFDPPSNHNQPSKSAPPSRDRRAQDHRSRDLLLRTGRPTHLRPRPFFGAFTGLGDSIAPLVAAGDCVALPRASPYLASTSSSIFSRISRFSLRNAFAFSRP